MARLEDLVARIPDRALAKEIEGALANLKRRRRFGIVFEEHIPEMSTLTGLQVGVGMLVQQRNDLTGQVIYSVTEISAGGQATLVPVGDGEALTLPIDDLLVVKRFGDPIYPTLTPLGATERGGDRPYHAVINGENYHSLQLLLYLYEGQVDCLYLDPPYNTGARDWKYNNRYVDNNDSWRHSKWLSFMEKRLTLARRLLRPDGVLILTIDEHEVNHLGMLLERIFPEYLRYMVTMVINPKGTFKANFGRVDEQAFFIVPNRDADVIIPHPIPAAVTNDDDELTDRLICKLLELSNQDSATLLDDNQLLDPGEYERSTGSYRAHLRRHGRECRGRRRG